MKKTKPMQFKSIRKTRYKLTNDNSLLVGFICLVMIIFAVGCSNSTNSISDSTGPKIYLVNQENKSIESIDLDLKEIIDQSNVAEIIDYVFVLLNKGVSSSTYKPVIKDLNIIRYYNVDDKNVTINFNKVYYDLPIEEEIYLRNSVVKSLTSFEQIDSVEIFVNGVPLKLNDIIIGRLYDKDIMITYDEANLREDAESVVMYFPNDDLSKLVATYTTVSITSNRKLEEIIVEELFMDERNIMPKDVKLLNVYTHEGICFVDFSSEFQTSMLPVGISERIAIYALVNTLSELPNITSVQILVEGEKALTFQGNLNLNRIFTKNYSLIETDFGGD